MQETVEQYISRILSFSESKDPLAVLAATPGRLRMLIDGAEPDRWRIRPAPGRWSAGEVLAHLADVEIAIGWRFRSILARDGVRTQAYDQEVWASAFKYGEVEPAESLATFSAVRKSLLALLDRVDRARLEHHGLHEERGRETIQHMLRLTAGHDLNHLSQIESMLGVANAG